MMVQKFKNGSICDNRLLVKSRHSFYVAWGVQVWQMIRAAPFWCSRQCSPCFCLDTPLDQPKSYMDGVMNGTRASPEPLFKDLLRQE